LVSKQLYIGIICPVSSLYPVLDTVCHSTFTINQSSQILELGHSLKNPITQHAIKEWLNVLAAEVYDEGIQKLVTRYDKCLNVGGDFVEK
jgi:hypothetical protein